MTESEAEAKASIISGSFLFHELGPDLFERVVRLSRTQRYRRGSFVFHMGDEGDALYGVAQGLIRIWIPGADGRELTVVLMERGDIFGEIALLDGLPRAANASAIDDTLLIAIDRPLLVNCAMTSWPAPAKSMRCGWGFAAVKSYR